ncbi:hypothetical protein NliqN6_4048 [Naganishia liquefaciens]|uniref:F-actin-capping protein subunit beta n=1 Tax=Naganishia liquefaciens TaxID=104408 RepID=A0A8H3TU86_9TREE|nr:hypothetical protein NliqN6_4048 [Naganishia liquefaciens]
MDAYTATLDLLRRLPPTNVERNVDILCQLVPDLASDLLLEVDQPLRIAKDAETGREYLCSEYNRDSDSYRSPWSNAYDPPLSDGAVPSKKLRELEVAMNDAFDTYRDMYYEGGLSSVYLWDQEDGGFAGVILIKKTSKPSQSGNHGAWDSIHTLEVHERGRQAQYKVVSTTLLWVGNEAAATVGENGQTGVSLSGTMTRDLEQVKSLARYDDHIANVGRLIEEQENKMRNSLAEVYFGKTKDVVQELRTLESAAQSRQEQSLRRNLFEEMGGKMNKRAAGAV